MRLDRSEAEDFELDLLPLVDVVFLLLIFFLVATTFAKDEVELDLKLPKAASGQEGREGNTFTIHFAKDGRLVCDGREVTIEGLRQKLAALRGRKPEPDVLIRGDVEARYGLFAQVLDAVKAARLSRIQIRALPVEGGR